ncbi:cation transporter [Paenibacillus whitsoniae]|uniref:Copper chaperone n=1 Tax=Paenibacillus whitsoniae TaxID=2496558 RepID=A0A3S0A6V8_9BACL|nr:cation transporter [Paenibacillus whitsoniae]RTE11005.1 copper chaperone [Paenibacillus whitsoniae]
MHKITMIVEGMSCNHCVRTIESALQQLGAMGKVDLAHKSVHIEYDNSNTAITQDKLKEAIENKGFEVVAL